MTVRTQRPEPDDNHGILEGMERTTISFVRPVKAKERCPYTEHLPDIAERDICALDVGALTYGPSWLKRGGAGAFFVTFRKADRLEAFLPQFAYDIFAAIAADKRPEGMIDDVRDLRRYLMAWEAEFMQRGLCPAELRKNQEGADDPTRRQG